MTGFRDRRPGPADGEPPGLGEPIHVLVPHQFAVRNPPPGVIMHRTRKLLAHEVRSTLSPPCTTPARSLIDAAPWSLTDTAAVTLIASAFQQRLITSAQVLTVLSEHERLKRRPLIEAAVHDAGGGSHSLYEVEFLRLCRRAGLPEPSRQSARTDPTGRRRYRDIFFDPWGVHVEVDGAQHSRVMRPAEKGVRRVFADARRPGGFRPACEPAARGSKAAILEAVVLRIALKIDGWRSLSTSIRDVRSRGAHPAGC